ncbi:MAG: magnesium transporter CorA family protein [Oscillospiraceae bacterium]|nr:magnesium transporter CorA family protein [Oscillospiraceae bacterium]
MLNFYKTVNNRIVEIPVMEDGCWVSAIAPTEEEINLLVNTLHLEPDFVRAALDEEEASRVESDDENNTLIIVDVPIAEGSKEDNTLVYSTMPMAILYTPRQIVTISLKSNAILEEFRQGIVKNLQTHQKTQFFLKLLLRVASRFLQYLKQIDRLSNTTESLLHKMMRNEEIIQLLNLEKSLVYFSTSLKSNEVTLEKIMRGRIIRLYEEDEDLLEDVIIEVKQAIEMCSIYSNTLSGTMDAVSSIISNNLNNVMKVLTSLTIIMTIPNIIFGMYGMNVSGLPFPTFSTAIAMAAVLMVIVTIVLNRKGLL